MEILAIIPARGGSKRTPRKNVKLLAGKPLIAYSIEAGLKSKLITRIVVSTEDREIKEVAEKFGAEVIDRPPELAQDETKTAPVMIHAVEQLEKTGYKADIIVLLQPTCPTRDEKIIDTALEKLVSSDKDSIFSAVNLGKTMPKWKKTFDDKMVALYDYHLRPRHQDKHLQEDMFSENGAFYAIRTDAFKKYKDFLGENVEVFDTGPIIDIDTPEDFERAEKIILEEK